MSVDTSRKVDVDARGLKCPWPTLRLARAMRASDSIVIVADDPAAFGEIQALAKIRKWCVKPVETGIGAGFFVGR